MQTVTKQFKSESQKGVVYTTVITEEGKVTCNCKGWTIKRWDRTTNKPRVRHCKHTTAIVGKRRVRSEGEYLYVVGGRRLDS